MAARMPMTTITTNNSTIVKAEVATELGLELEFRLELGFKSELV